MLCNRFNNKCNIMYFCLNFKKPKRSIYNGCAQFYLAVVKTFVNRILVAKIII